MNSAKEIVTFENFDPSRAVLDFAHDIQDQICGESPSDSIAKTVVKKLENSFMGEMKIVSAAGTFLATISGSDPGRVLAGLAKSVRNQLREWRVNRWHSPILH